MMKASVSASPTTLCCAMSSLVRYPAMLSLGLAQSRSASLFTVTMNCPSAPSSRMDGCSASRAGAHHRAGDPRGTFGPGRVQVDYRGLHSYAATMLAGRSPEQNQPT
jgi:hypothetical protein